jgi:hypothetical protein
VRPGEDGKDGLAVGVGTPSEPVEHSSAKLFCSMNV